MSGHDRGDAAFDRWYQQHFDRIRVLCSRILRDPAAAEDMAQEALLRAWMRRDQMREEDLGAWLSVVARNLCLSAMRRDGRLVLTDEVPEHADHRADPATEVVRRESRRNVRRALSKLGDRNRRVIYLREIHEQEYDEIGSEFGVSAEGARTIAFRARRVLREHLAAVGEGFSGVLIGVRVRLRSGATRARSWMVSEPAMTPLLQAGLAIAITAGVLFGSANAPATARLQERPEASVLAVPVGGGSPAQGKPISFHAGSSVDGGASLAAGSPIKPAVDPGDIPCGEYPGAGFTSDLPGDSDPFAKVWLTNDHPTRFGRKWIPRMEKAVGLVLPTECPT